MPMPVSPRITAPGTQPPLGVASKMLPSASMTAIWVVSFITPAESCLSDARTIGSDTARAVSAPPWTLAFQYGHVFTRESYLSGSPATNVVDARFESMRAARSFA